MNNHDMPWFMIPVMYYLAPAEIDDEDATGIEQSLNDVLKNYKRKSIETAFDKIIKASPIKRISETVLIQLMTGVDNACCETGWSREDALKLLSRAGNAKLKIQ